MLGREQLVTPIMIESSRRWGLIPSSILLTYRYKATLSDRKIQHSSTPRRHGLAQRITSGSYLAPHTWSCKLYPWVTVCLVLDIWNNCLIVIRMWSSMFNLCEPPLFQKHPNRMLTNTSENAEYAYKINIVRQRVGK